MVIVLLLVCAGIATAQRETVYMAVLSSFRSVQNVGGDPEFGLFLSTDAGVTWEHRGWRDYIRTFYSEEANDGTIWSACGNGVLRSTDSGKRWRVTTGWEVTEVLKVKAAPQVPFLIFASTAYGVFRSTDRGDTWEKKSEGMRRPFSGDVCIDRTNPGRVLAATEEGVFLSEDRGEHWRQSGLAGKGVRVVMQDAHDASRFWLGTEEDGVFCSSDRGGQWEQRSHGLRHSAVYTISFHPRYKDWIYIGTYGDGVLRSTDAGMHWEGCSHSLSDLRVHSLLVLPSNPNILLAGTLNRGLFRSTNGGETWQYSCQDSSQVWGLSVMYVDSKNKQRD
jgi:photosystem II stability/assembly factor-like uncharacterized protein